MTPGYRAVARCVAAVPVRGAHRVTRARTIGHPSAGHAAYRSLVVRACIAVAVFATADAAVIGIRTSLTATCMQRCAGVRIRDARCGCRRGRSALLRDASGIDGARAAPCRMSSVRHSACGGARCANRIGSAASAATASTSTACMAARASAGFADATQYTCSPVVVSNCAFAATCAAASGRRSQRGRRIGVRTLERVAVDKGKSTARRRALGPAGQQVHDIQAASVVHRIRRVRLEHPATAGLSCGPSRVPPPPGTAAGVLLRVVGRDGQRLAEPSVRDLWPPASGPPCARSLPALGRPLRRAHQPMLGPHEVIQPAHVLGQRGHARRRVDANRTAP